MGQDYFKGYKLFKLIQLVILILFAIVSFLYIYLDDDLRTSIYTNKNLLTICVFIWAFMIYSVACIVLDFYQLEGHIAHDNVLNRAVYVDSLTGIPNRMGCDVIFEEYNSGRDISAIGSALIRISNLDSINHKKGRAAGNVLLVNFSRIIERVGAHYGFVGRNNGNDFLLVIDKCSQENIDSFINELKKETEAYNKIARDENIEIEITDILNEDVKSENFNEFIGQLYDKARGK